MNTPSALQPEVSLREVRASDLPVLYEHQLDPEATRMAAFPSRPRDAFMTHWAKVMANPSNTIRTILFAGSVAGQIGAWTDAAERLVGYWVGREFWGRGVATAALLEFLRYEPTRPLTARVVKHNVASIRVLTKAGFTRVGSAIPDEPAAATDEDIVFRL